MEAPPSDNLYITDLPQGFDESSVKTTFEQYGSVMQCRVLPDKTGGQGRTAALVRLGSVAEAQWVVENINGNIPQGLDSAVKVRFADTPESKAARQQYGKAGGGSWGGGSWGGGGGGGSWSGGKGAGGGGGAGGGEQRSAPYSGGGGAWIQKGAGGPAAGGGVGGKGGGGKGEKGRGGGKGGKGTTVQILFNGLLAAQALPGGKGYTNDENALYIAGLPSDSTDLDLYKIFSSFGALAPKGVRAMLKEDGTCKGIGFVNFLDSTASQTAIMTLHGTQMPDGTSLIVKTKTPGKGGGGKGGGGELALEE